MSDTPKTDAERKRVYDDEKNYPESYDVAVAAWEFAERLEKELKEVESLRKWKTEMINLESGWDIQAVGKLLGISLGMSIRANIQSKIEELLSENARLEIMAAEGARQIERLKTELSKV